MEKTESKPEVTQELHHHYHNDWRTHIRPQDFHWVVFGIGAAALFVLLAATYAIINIITGDWSNWQVPAIIAIVYIVTVTIFALIFALKTVRQELKDQTQKNDKE